MKRDHGINQSSPPTKLPRKNIAQEALRIVLQYWMIVNLGWSTNYFDNWIKIIRAEIIDGRLQAVSHDARGSLRNQLVFHLENGFGYFDEDYATLKMTSLKNISSEEFILSVSFILRHCASIFNGHSSSSIRADLSRNIVTMTWVLCKLTSLTTISIPLLV